MKRSPRTQGAIVVKADSPEREKEDVTILYMFYLNNIPKAYIALTMRKLQ